MFPSSNHRNPYTVIKSFNFFMFGSIAVLVSFLPLFLKYQGFSNVQIGILVSVGPVISVLANPFWGYWGDRLQNMRLVLLILLTGNLLISPFLFQVSVFLPLFMIVSLFYFFQTSLFPMSTSMIIHATEKTNISFGAFRLWGSVGFAIVAVAISPVVQAIGIGKLGWIYALFVIISIALALRLPEEGKSPAPMSVRDLSLIFKNKYFVTFLFLSMLVSFPNMMNYTFLSLYIQELGGSEVLIGWSFFLAAIGEIPVFLLLDRYLKNNSKMMIGLLGVTSLLFSVRWLLMGVVATPLQVTFIQLLHSITFGIYFYTGTKLAAHLIERKYLASAQAAYALAWTGISGIAVGGLGGLIYDAVGPRDMYVLISVVSFVGTAGFALMWRMMKGEPRLRETRGV